MVETSDTILTIAVIGGVTYLLYKSGMFGTKEQKEAQQELSSIQTKQGEGITTIYLPTGESMLPKGISKSSPEFVVQTIENVAGKNVAGSVISTTPYSQPISKTSSVASISNKTSTSAISQINKSIPSISLTAGITSSATTLSTLAKVAPSVTSQVTQTTKPLNTSSSILSKVKSAVTSTISKITSAFKKK